MQLEREEEKAKENGVGIWNKSIKSMFGSSPKKVRQNERILVELTDIIDATRFHVRIVGEHQYPKVENELSKFQPHKAEDLEKPVKRGTLCAARFKEDNKWYRARILKSLGKGDYEVEFIDFGNVGPVNSDDMKRLSPNL